MAITKVFGTIIPALYIGHEGKQWTIAGTIMEINVVGDQVLLPEGLNVYVRISIEGSGRVDAVLRLRQHESDTIIHEQAMVFGTPPEAEKNETALSTLEAAIRLPIDRLYPAIAASSLGATIRTAFVLEFMIPENILEAGFEGPTPETQGVVIASAPLYLICNPKQTLTQGTRG